MEAISEGFDVEKTLLSLMAIPADSELVSICKTGDGFYIGQKGGEVGYNHFIGKPKPVHEGPGRDLILARWAELTVTERAIIIARTLHPKDGEPINLVTEFGLPI